MKLYKFIPLLLLIQSQAFAASTDITYLTGSKAAYTTINTTTDGNGAAYCNISNRDNKFIFWMDADAVSGTLPTLDVSIEYSGDGGTTWKTLYAFTQVTTVDSVIALHNDESGDSPTWVAPCLRVVTLAAGTNPVYGLKVYMNFERSWF